MPTLLKKITPRLQSARAGGASSAVPGGDRRRVAGDERAMQLGDVGDRVGRSVLSVSNDAPGWADQQFGHPGVNDGIGNIGGAYGQPTHVEY